MKSIPLRKADIVLMAGLLSGAILLFAGGKLFFQTASSEMRVRAYRDGEIVLDAGLGEDLRIPVHSGDGGQNMICIRDGAVYVESADCPGQDCVKRGRISGAGEEIICLPHRLLIRIEGGGTEDAPDTVAE